MANNHPKIWILQSPHSGDNTQLLALAENLGWPYELKSLSYSPWQVLTRVVPGATLMGLKREARAQLSAPFPDLIIGAGHSTEAAAFWVKAQSPRAVKLVYLGTPITNLEKFDLVVTTPQYGLPKRANILHIDLPMHSVEKNNLAKAALLWQPRLAHLPKPWTALLVGGASGPYTFTVEAATRLAQEAQKYTGSLLITTSARTTLDVTAALRLALTGPHYFHAWQDNAADNPFFGYLTLADQFIVTADSISMLSEACATAKPVMMFDTEHVRFAMRDNGKNIKLLGSSFYATLFRMTMRFGPQRWTRDLRIVHQQLIAAGLANWLGEPLKVSTPSLAPSSLQQATSRVVSLFET